MRLFKTYNHDTPKLLLEFADYGQAWKAVTKDLQEGQVDFLKIEIIMIDGQIRDENKGMFALFAEMKAGRAISFTDEYGYTVTYTIRN